MPSLSACRARSAVAAFAPLGAAAVAAVLFGSAYVSLEHPAYAWDWGRYFRIYRIFGGLAHEDPLGAAGALLGSIAGRDYNAASIVPLLPIYGIWGDSRSAYVAAILALYTVPACFLAAQLAKGRGGDPVDRPKALAVTLAALLFWPLWASALRGMPDVAGLIPLGIATMLLLRTGFMTRATPAQGLLLGLCLWSAFLLRRWYAYSILAVGMVAVGFAIAAVVRAPNEERPALATTATVAFAIGALTLAGCLAALQAPLVERILHTNYGDIYAAYQAPFVVQAPASVRACGSDPHRRRCRRSPPNRRGAGRRRAVSGDRVGRHVPPLLADTGTRHPARPADLLLDVPGDRRGGRPGRRP